MITITGYSSDKFEKMDWLISRHGNLVRQNGVALYDAITFAGMSGGPVYQIQARKNPREAE
jgi:V8-like Glu-specific endopeptidase